MAKRHTDIRRLGGILKAAAEQKNPAERNRQAAAARRLLCSEAAAFATADLDRQVMFNLQTGGVFGVLIEGHRELSEFPAGVTSTTGHDVDVLKAWMRAQAALCIGAR